MNEQESINMNRKYVDVHRESVQQQGGGADKRRISWFRRTIGARRQAGMWMMSPDGTLHRISALQGEEIRG